MLWLAIFDSLYILNSVLLFGIPTLYAEYEQIIFTLIIFK